MSEIIVNTEPAVQTIPVKGEYIRKKNFNPIGKSICILIQSAREIPGNRIHVNGFCSLGLEHIEVVDKAEADKLNDLFKNIQISETLHFDPETSCTREETGEPKGKIHSEKAIKIKLFIMRQKYPEKDFQAYKCSNCGFYHIGKTKEVQELADNLLLDNYAQPGAVTVPNDFQKEDYRNLNPFANPAKVHHAGKSKKFIKRVKVYSPEVIFEFMKNNPKEMFYVDEEGNRCKLRRARVFFEKGCKCKLCPTTGSFFALEQWKAGDFHFDFFAIDQDGDEVLMTIDHIVPKSKGGPDHIDNYDPMCKVCNEIKWSN